MNVSSINSYNYLSFQARNQQGRYSRKPAHAKNNAPATRVLALGLAGVTTLGGAGFLIRGCQNDKPQELPVATNSAYVDTYEQPTESIILETTPAKKTYVIYEPTITTRPISERTPEYHTVVRGDRLADIVKHYAEIDKDTPDEKLVPYYNLLEADNPGAWEKRDVIHLGLKIRVDSILPENIVITYPNDNEQQELIEDEYEINETEETLPPQNTSDEDTVTINDLTFAFDLGTIHKTFTGDYSGLVYGKYVVLDKKVGGTLEKTEYAGTNSDSEKVQTTIYDEDGKIIKKQVYENNDVAEVYTYEYKSDRVVETCNDLRVDSSYVNIVSTTYDDSDDFVISKEFYVGKNAVADFNFNNDTVQIGEKTWKLDIDTFIFNARAIGSKRYYGTIDGQLVRFDALKNGFCVEYINDHGQIASREQYDAKGNLICVE